MATVILNPKSIDSYKKFKAIKSLPCWDIKGRVATFPDEYAELLGVEIEGNRNIEYDPSRFLFDYQKAISSIAIGKRKYAVFVDCGYGKTLIMLEFSKTALSDLSKRDKGFLIVSPLMVIPQTLSECERWYPGMEVEQVPASKLQEWTDNCGGKIGITNYEAIKPDLRQGKIGGMALDESSMLKSHYGKWGTKLIELGEGLTWKLCLTGTPAPNDRIEYANHAVFLDRYPTVNSFLATFFINRGQTQDRWAIKNHAIEPFYRSLSHWSIFMSNPSTYGWRDNAGTIPPIKVHVHDVELTKEQRRAFGVETGQLFANNTGGITSRATIGQLAKGRYKGKTISTNKPKAIGDLLDSWPDESTLVWCRYNAEQERLVKYLGDVASISGDTPVAKRIELIEAFKAGEIKTLVSKPKILGFGLNLQCATRQVFSTLQDSYEEYYQAVKRSNRVGSTRPLNVHLPLTDLEQPMAQNVLRKADMVQHDTEEQERIFKQCATTF